MQDITKESSSIIIDTLISHGVLPESAREHTVTDNYELGALISAFTEQPVFSIPMENYGTDDDAGKDYEALLRLFTKKSGGKLQFDSVSSTTVGDQVTIEFLFNGKAHRLEFEQSSDHLSDEFMDYFTQLQTESEAGCFLFLNGGDFPGYCFIPTQAYNTLLEHGAISQGDEDW